MDWMKSKTWGFIWERKGKRGSVLQVQSCKWNSGVGFSLEALVSCEQCWWNCSEPERQHMAENTDYNIVITKMLPWLFLAENKFLLSF